MLLITTHDVVIQLTNITLIDQSRLSQSLLCLQVTSNRLPILLGRHVRSARPEIVGQSLTVDNLLEADTIAGAVITRQVIAGIIAAKRTIVRGGRLNVGPFTALISPVLSSLTKSGDQAG